MLCYLFRRDVLKKCDRVVVDSSPTVWVDAPKYLYDFWMPSPPEISGEFKQFLV
jgi:hypothetical protein